MAADGQGNATSAEAAAGAAVYSRLVLANRLYNRRSIFSNLGDGAAGLEEALASAFPRHSVSVVGTVALFTAHA